MNVLVFKIETIPDIEGGQAIYKLHGLDQDSTSKALFHLRKQKTGSNVLPLYLQRISAISVVYRGMGDGMEDEVTVKSLGDENSTEAELLTAFFDIIAQRAPTLVSWDGSGFDLPVIHYRSLKNNISAPDYWEKGDNNNSFQQENYLSRYHDKHTDLRDVLSSYNESEGAPLNDIALMLGYPGEQGMQKSEVWDQYRQGKLPAIRAYNETGAINTYLIFLRFQVIRGLINEAQLAQEYALLRSVLEKTEQAHLIEFSELWQA